jgi:hypothetical protein
MSRWAGQFAVAVFGVAVGSFVVAYSPMTASGECGLHGPTASPGDGQTPEVVVRETPRELVVTLPADYGEGNPTSVVIVGGPSQGVRITGPAHVSATAVGGAGVPGASGASGAPVH